jgi:hypothetical protein
MYKEYRSINRRGVILRQTIKYVRQVVVLWTTVRPVLQVPGTVEGSNIGETSYFLLLHFHPNPTRVGVMASFFQQTHRNNNRCWYLYHYVAPTAVSSMMTDDDT